ncbi:MAG: phosphoribosyl-AMP cyclohydrolase [Fimbriimonadales bacterium]|nr:MAG: phosphoribosyl-AMP cyclohydrolase [Fimbriimonadales bacterium]
MEWIDTLKYDPNGLIPAIIQDAATGQVLMVAYMNRESLRRTVETGLCTYWSRSRQQFWVKGETSGHLQHVKRILVDCDADAVLIQVEQVGVACHTGHRSCFYREAHGDTLVEVEPIIVEPESVYGRS